MVKLSVDRVNVYSLYWVMVVLGLMFICMYIGKEKVSLGRILDFNFVVLDSELVIVVMEWVFVFFDRIRKGFFCEVRVVVRILF